MEEKLKRYAEKLDDLENRGRRKNLRIVGIPESVSDSELRGYLEKWLISQLSLETSVGPLITERAHRLGQKREGPSRPRVVMVRFLNFVQKEIVLRAARAKRNQSSGGQKLLIFQDYSTQVSLRRKEFPGVCAALINRGARFALMYPARLRLEHGRKQHFF